MPPYLGWALDNVLAQTHRDLKVIVVTNGWTGGSSGSSRTPQV
ncbi:MAG: glycosyltransferase family 2 protein [Atopobiaceae bacterium]|nr:glycosyltransferase family 2 protein [Atopobiaceae bacterium]